MKSKKTTPKYFPEVHERAVRMVQEHRGAYPSLRGQLNHRTEGRLGRGNMVFDPADIAIPISMAIQL